MKSTRIVQIGNLKIGGGNPIRVQSMCNTDTRDATATVKQILELEKSGCEIIRVAVPDMTAAKAIKDIKKNIHIPLVADIHFDYKLALESIKNGVDKVALIWQYWFKRKCKKSVDACKDKIFLLYWYYTGSLEKE
jgi:(E)-4-hydroxy-3-methylbut-2-enyl-diphosphate synthase